MAVHTWEGGREVENDGCMLTHNVALRIHRVLDIHDFPLQEQSLVVVEQ